LGAARGDHDKVLSGLIAGDVIAAWCIAEPGGTWGPAPGVATTAERTSAGWAITGTKSPVEAAVGADHLLVAARTGDGVAQFLLPATAPGVTITPLRSLDFTRRYAEVRFDHAEVGDDAVVDTGDGDAIEHQLQLTLALQCAETVGVIDRVFEFTVEYAFDRYTFGRALASYQALKHRFADMKMWLEGSFAIAAAAARAVQDNAPNRAELVSAGKVYVGRQGGELMQDCVQLHGGIGVTFDHDLHLYLRRVTSDIPTFGSPAEHAARITQVLETEKGR
jgi:alkylation response protein AidB-like acyl-CoA dehydrogenase